MGFWVRSYLESMVRVARVAKEITLGANDVLVDVVGSAILTKDLKIGIEARVEHPDIAVSGTECAAIAEVLPRRSVQQALRGLAVPCHRGVVMMLWKVKCGSDLR